MVQVYFTASGVSSLPRTRPSTPVAIVARDSSRAGLEAIRVLATAVAVHLALGGGMTWIAKKCA